MCGVIAALTPVDAAPVLLEGLRQLEYRGYDSAGIAVLGRGGMEVARVVGRVDKLARRVNGFKGRAGVGHTRWATHGPATLVNAHPHVVGDVALAHNGQIANDQELRASLCRDKARIKGQTDSELIAHLLARGLGEGKEPLRALRATTARLAGTYGLVALVTKPSACLLVARQGSPLLLGWDKRGGLYAASDVMAFPDGVHEVTHLKDGQHAVLTADGVKAVEAAGRSCRLARKRLSGTIKRGDKGGHRHYMHKEMHEQPGAVSATLAPLVGNDGRLKRAGMGKGMAAALGKARAVRLLACGTSLHAARVAAAWARELGTMPFVAEVASEYVPGREAGDELVLALSQSGETADTLGAARRARAARAMRTAALVNVPTSTLAQEADIVLRTDAGLEIGVASTKAFTAQLAALRAFVLYVARVRGDIDEACLRRAVKDLLRASADISQALAAEGQVRDLVPLFAAVPSTLFVGRGVMHAIAQEAALKLMEISYVHASAFPAGELKHGPLALVDKDMPVVALVQDGPTSGKMVATNYEISARGGKVVTFTCGSYAGLGETVSVPASSPVGQVFATTVLTQLLAYHVALARGTDVDKPRNLAKSVTVE